MRYSFNDAQAAEQHETRTSRCSAIAASTTRAGPRSRAIARLGVLTTPPFDDDVWELYDAGRLDPGE